MLGGILAAFIGLLGTVFGVYWKYIRKPPDPAAEVANVEERMARDLADKPGDDAALERLRDGSA